MLNPLAIARRAKEQCNSPVNLIHEVLFGKLAHLRDYALDFCFRIPCEIFMIEHGRKRISNCFDGDAIKLAASGR